MAQGLAQIEQMLEAYDRKIVHVRISQAASRILPPNYEVTFNPGFTVMGRSRLRNAIVVQGRDFNKLLDEISTYANNEVDPARGPL